MKKPNKTAHTDNKKFGMGDFYGMGKRNPMGRTRDSMVGNPTPPNKLKKAPRSLA